MPFCENCGTEHSDNAKFCSNCGAKIGQANNNQSEPNEIIKPKPEKKGFWKSVGEAFTEQAKLDEEKRQRKAQELVKCPKCGSTQITADKKGFGLGKAAVGGLIAGPVGLLAGGAGKNKVMITCLKCGHQWKVGKK